MTQRILILLILMPFIAKAQINIQDVGAKGDGITDNTKIIQRVIDSLAQKGGGKVIIPKGRFLTGTILLKTGIILHITEGGILLGSARRDDYKKNDWFALILAKGEKNIKIEGKGTIDGQGKALAADVERMLAAGLLPKNTKPYKRPDESQRPQIIEMTDCQNIRIDGVTIKNAACWVQTYHQCVDMVFNKMKVESTTYWNNDGLDLVDCKNVRINNCFINSSDDALCLKSYSTQSSCENIHIKRCTLRSSASAIKFGTASYGGFKHIRIKNIFVYDTYRSAIALESVDGGTIEDIKIKNIKAHNTGNAIFIRLGHRQPSRPVGSIKNISITNLTADIPRHKPDSGYALEGPPADSVSNLLPSSIVGLPNHRIEQVFLKNIHIRFGGGGTPSVAYRSPTDFSTIPEHPREYPEFSMFGELPAWGFFLRHTEGVHFKRVRLYLKEKDYRPALVHDDTHNSFIPIKTKDF
ncbi:MAG: glycoside hydrolase family 28 protein [Saprospiraceae bacterium]|nr:glycoside hydrolase family 28 protein [Saprospiraceae bacterium]